MRTYKNPCPVVGSRNNRSPIKLLFYSLFLKTNIVVLHKTESPDKGDLIHKVISTHSSHDKEKKFTSDNMDQRKRTIL